MKYLAKNVKLSNKHKKRRGTQLIASKVLGIPTHK